MVHNFSSFISLEQSRCWSGSSSEGTGTDQIVDLTADSDREVVDLTSPITKTKMAITREAILISESEDDVVVLPSTPPGPPPPVANSPTHAISCPICMDSMRTFTRSGRALVTTKCGHLFCDNCLKRSIALLHKCPTCAEKLTTKQFHRIYI